MGVINFELLDLVFGADSVGETPLERAKTSKQRFVRSQVQIAFASEGATGRILTAYEALQTFGWDNLFAVATDGVACVVKSGAEPANTLKEQRSHLGLSVCEIADRLGVSEEEVAKAELPGRVSPIRLLEKIGALLALDERRLGYKPNAGRDADLGVRLRELRNRDVSHFYPKTVFELSEAAWVISRQNYLVKALNYTSVQRINRPSQVADYKYPVYKVGYRLAGEAREILGLSEDEPIESLRVLMEEYLEIPLVQQRMNSHYAGATISNKGVRGIVVNEGGMNSNVWVRRMTLCHEIGHLLWDPDGRMTPLKVDEYADVERDVKDDSSDPVEARANAFAIAFLAPPSGVMRIVQECDGDVFAIVSKVMSYYGISASAAKQHVKNVAQYETVGISVHNLPSPEVEWNAREDLSIAYFPIQSTPITRRGKFAWFVTKAVGNGILSEDTAASYLGCTVEDFKEHSQTIISLWP